MMKKCCLLMIMVTTTLVAQAQEAETSQDNSKLRLLLDQISLTTSFGTTSVAVKDLGNASLGNITLGELGAAFKTNDHISIGISVTGQLGNCNSGYYNAEGVFQGFEQEDDADDDADDIDDDDMDDQNDCEDGIGSVMGTITYKFSDKVPVFVQASGGYAIGLNAPAYSAMIGYHQKLFSELGITAGIRFSDIFHKIPADAVTVTSSSGLKGEIGLSWNF
ncbi:MAG: hypothetical protein ACR2MX_10670 [Cyclobacteriaceae bacterium]